MKAFLAGACVTLAIIGFEIATGIEMSMGVRMLITLPACVLAGILVEEK